MHKAACQLQSACCWTGHSHHKHAIMQPARSYGSHAMTPCNSLGKGLHQHPMGQKEAAQGLLPAARPSLRAGNNNRLSCLLKPCKEQVLTQRCTLVSLCLLHTYNKHQQQVTECCRLLVICTKAIACKVCCFNFRDKISAASEMCP